MKHTITKKYRKHSYNKRLINLIPNVFLTICLLLMMSFNCLNFKQRHYRQSALIRNTVIDTIVYFNLNKESESKKSNLYVAHATYYYRGGEKCANGESFQPYSKLTCAASHKFPFGTKLRITNRENGKCVTVKVTDRGSFYKKRGHEYDLDLTYYAFSKISEHHRGRISITYKSLN